MKFYFILVFCFLYNLSVFGQISTLNSTDDSILITPRGLKGKTNNGVSLGENALFSNTTGINNTAMGAYALNFNTTGVSNTAFGKDAGGGIVNGSNNVFLGSFSRASSDISNAIAIGSGAIVTQSNAIQLGNSSITNVKTSGIISVNGLGINGDPKPSAVVDLSNSSKGFLPPKLNSSQRNSISSPEIGLTIFNTDSNCLEFYLAEGWYNLCKNQLVAVADIEGNSYGLVSIGTQVWLDQNLNVTKFNNGDSFSEVLTVSEWNTTSNPAWCWYGNTPKSNYLGKLYNWNVVNDARNVCPVGFHIPTDSEWTVLTNFFGGENVAAGPLKQTGTTTWYSPNTGATNASKFSATSNGYRNFEYTIYTDSNNYSALGSYGTWWTKTNFDTLKAYHRYMYWGNVAVNRGYSNKKNGFGIRCLKD